MSMTDDFGKHVKEIQSLPGTTISQLCESLQKYLADTRVRADAKVVLIKSAGLGPSIWGVYDDEKHILYLNQ